MTVTLLPGGEDGLTATNVSHCVRIIINSETTINSARTVLSPPSAMRITVVSWQIESFQNVDGLTLVTLSYGGGSPTTFALGVASSQNATVFGVRKFEPPNGYVPFQIPNGNALKIRVDPIAAAVGSTYSGWIDVYLAP